MTEASETVAACTPSELLAVMAGRLLRDGQVVFAGVGVPLLAATLAQRLHAPHLTILFEGGTIGPFIVPGELPPSTNEQIRRSPDHTRIPFFAVDAVVEAPIGCAPHECYGVYEPFFKSLDAYAEQIAGEPIAGCQRYLERYYYAPKSWSDYLELLGMEEVLDACRRGRSVHND